MTGEPDTTEAFEELGAEFSDAPRAKMMGHPCFKLGGKIFVCHFHGDAVFKLSGDTHAEALALDGAHLFDPSGGGRPMKQWVQVPAQHVDRWMDFAAAAAAEVVGG